MRIQVSVEVMMSILLSMLMAFSISAMLARGTVAYGAGLDQIRNYSLAANLSVSGMERLCPCHAIT